MHVKVGGIEPRPIVNPNDFIGCYWHTKISVMFGPVNETTDSEVITAGFMFGLGQELFVSDVHNGIRSW
jgi:hypothetical protein